MANTLVAPEQETFPNRIRWTRAQCEELVRSGQIVGRYELVDGEILSKMGQKPPHAITIMLLAQWLTSLLGASFVRMQLPITLPGEEGITNEPEPDIAVTVAPTTTYASRHPTPEDLQLVVEVSDTTRRFDLTTKALLYARVGIREYWVMDIVQRCVHIHRSLARSGYEDVAIYEAAALVSMLARPQDSVSVSALLPPTDVA